MCKSFYALTLMKELGLKRDIWIYWEILRNIERYWDILPKTPMKFVIMLKKTYVLLSIAKDLCNYFHLSVNNSNKCLPLMYWLSKSQKAQIKSVLIFKQISIVRNWLKPGSVTCKIAFVSTKSIHVLQLGF